MKARSSAIASMDHNNEIVLRFYQGGHRNEAKILTGGV